MENKAVDKIEKYIKEKRNELIWALALQGYTGAQIGRIFNRDRSTVLRIIGMKPVRWTPKWVKVEENKKGMAGK